MPAVLMPAGRESCVGFILGPSHILLAMNRRPTTPRCLLAQVRAAAIGALMASLIVACPAMAASVGSESKGGLSADLELLDIATVGQIRPGTVVRHETAVRNLGPATATSVVFEDVLPPEVQFQSIARVPSTLVCTTPPVGSSGAVRCTLPALAPQALTAVLVFAVVPASTAPGTVLRYSSTGSSATPDPTPANNSLSRMLLVQSGAERADLSVAVSDSPDPATPGSQLTYTTVVTNAGPDAAADLDVYLGFPRSADEVAITAPPGWTCVLENGPINIPPPNTYFQCEIFAMAPGSATFRIEIRVPTWFQGTYGDAFVGSATIDPDPTNNSDTESTLFGTGTAAAVPLLSRELGVLLALVMLALGAIAIGRPR